MPDGNSQIVDVDLTTLLLELPQLIGGESTEHLTVLQCRKSDKVVASEKPSEIAGARSSRFVRLALTEGFSKRRQQVFHKSNVIRTEHPYGELRKNHD